MGSSSTDTVKAIVSLRNEVQAQNRILDGIGKDLHELTLIMRDREASDPMRQIERMMAETDTDDDHDEMEVVRRQLMAERDRVQQREQRKREDTLEDDDELPESERWRLGE